MTPKEKAEELIKRFMSIETDYSRDGGYTFEHIWRNDAKQCALICVDEIIKTGLLSLNPTNNSFLMQDTKQYWNDVKSELNL